jgi:hypothetical protein
MVRQITNLPIDAELPMRHAVPVLITLLAISATNPAVGQAETLEALTGGGRYQLMEINDKIVRLDTRTGRFEMCRMENDDWKCLVAQDDRQRLEDAIAKLSKRVADLEAAQRADDPLAQVSTNGMETAPPALVAANEPAVAEAAPATPSPERPLTTASIDTGPVPQEPVPAMSGSTAPETGPKTAPEPAATGKPFDISPGATSAEEEKPGLIDRITGLVPKINW